MAGPKLFFIDPKDISDNHVTLSGAHLRHIKKVLRLVKGDRIWICDKRRRYLIELSDINYKKAEAKILEAIEIPELPSIEIVIAQSVLKGEKMDMLIQKATEIGISKVIPVLSQRTIVKLFEKRASSKERRWQEIAKEASQQCGRTDIPQVGPILKFDDAFSVMERSGIDLILWEGEHKNSLKSILRGSKKEAKRINVFIGPEGGFSDNEVSLAKENGFTPVSLGSLILRAETAAITIIGIIQYELGSIG